MLAIVERLEAYALLAKAQRDAKWTLQPYQRHAVLLAQDGVQFPDAAGEAVGKGAQALLESHASTGRNLLCRLFDGLLQAAAGPHAHGEIDDGIGVQRLLGHAACFTPAGGDSSPAKKSRPQGDRL
ncbi:MAG: hypothetical protein KGM44_12265 [bacterium]|nr:hypothetical protein [bacterium]